MKRKGNGLCFFAVVFAVFLCLSGCAGKKDMDAGGGRTESRMQTEAADRSTEPESQIQEAFVTDIGKTEGQVQETSGEIRELVFPYELEGGKLIVNSLFQSEVANPDCGDEMGEETATLEILNQSGEFLVSADITVTMPDGTGIPFTVTNLPAGKKVWVFASDNAAIEQETVCYSMECEAVFEKTAVLLEEQVEVEIQDTSILLTNRTDEELTDMSVGCHCLFDDVYFGGLTYIYPVESIPAGESVTVEAEDCYLGSVDVVFITREQ